MDLKDILCIVLLCKSLTKISHFFLKMYFGGSIIHNNRF